MQFYSNYGNGAEEWHGNGVARFATLSGVVVLAITHRMDAEAVLFKDPWSYTTADGGSAVLQRFGTPWKWTSASDVSYRYFGGPDAPHSGCPTTAARQPRTPSSARLPARTCERLARQRLAPLPAYVYPLRRPLCTPHSPCPSGW